MDIPAPLLNIINEAKETAKGTAVSTLSLSATIITPAAHIVPIGITTMMVHSDFQREHADVIIITLRIQPGVYQNQVLPYKDNIVLELVDTRGLSASSKRYRATPQKDGNANVQGGSSQTANLNLVDTNNFIAVPFQLMEVGFDAIRNATVSGSFVSAKVEDVLHNLLTTNSQGLGLTGADAFKGVNIERPVDNPKVFRQIMVRQGTRLVQLATYLQHEEGVGVYSRGINSYYRNGMWFVYPMTKQGRYGKIKNSLNIIRLPADVAPTLDVSYYQSSNAITIIATGNGHYQDDTDIHRQNHGAGNQIINPSSLSGETGTHYANGRALKTRQDSLSEYKTHNRGSGNERINMPPKATSNVFPSLSETTLRDVTYLTVEWHNSNHYLIDPNAPLKYYYLNKDGALSVREGCLIGIKSDLQPATIGADLQLQSYSELHIYLFPETQGTTKPLN